MRQIKIDERIIKHVLAEYNAGIVLLKGRAVLNTPGPIDPQLLAFVKKHKELVRTLATPQE